MRRGQDRHELAETIQGLIYPDGVGHIRGLRIGATREQVVEALGQPPSPASPITYTFEVDDPHDDGRRLQVEVYFNQGLVHILTARFFSATKLDVDGGYRLVRKHLKKQHGRPGKELTGVLKFLWDLSDGPGQTSVCRFKNADGVNVLEVSTRLKDGETLSSAAKGLTHAKRNQASA